VDLDALDAASARPKHASRKESCAASCLNAWVGDRFCDYQCKVRFAYRHETVANRNVRDFGVGGRSRGRFATPADFPQHDCSPCSHVHVRRERLGFIRRSRAIL
jgi:hypothetical protein